MMHKIVLAIFLIGMVYGESSAIPATITQSVTAMETSIAATETQSSTDATVALSSTMTQSAVPSSTSDANTVSTTSGSTPSSTDEMICYACLQDFNTCSENSATSECECYGAFIKCYDDFSCKNATVIDQMIYYCGPGSLMCSEKDCLCENDYCGEPSGQKCNYQSTSGTYNFDWVELTDLKLSSVDERGNAYSVRLCGSEPLALCEADAIACQTSGAGYSYSLGSWLEATYEDSPLGEFVGFRITADNGTVCPSNNKARSVTIDVLCDYDATPGTITQSLETSQTSCEYYIQVISSAGCPRKELPPTVAETWPESSVPSATPQSTHSKVRVN